MNAIYGALIRHILSVFGSWLVIRGIVSQEELPNVVNVISEFAGSAIVVVSLVWSIIRKLKDGKVNDNTRKTGRVGGSKG